ncbi:HlyD family secretion protein [Nostoc sp. CENA543]|uniref:ABC exporter membrane fusion protein n=1 Tax=Nostoc sp. CENA543 TaxID=1869241 RepID=UPI000CA1737B|nr:ABC exporter membrane fusion protein [Nostoc sp. CENA543]AUT02786.1 HlyD family secretion protein [Nostoc sp. CENA543]
MHNSKLDRSFSPQPILRRAIFLAIFVSFTSIGISVFTAFRIREASSQKVQAPTTLFTELKTITALGRIEPKGNVIQLSATTSSEGSRVEQLLVKEGDRVKAGQVIAILDSHDKLEAALKAAKEKVKVAQANLDRTKAGAKKGEVTAQQAIIARLQVEAKGDIAAQTATVARLQAEVQNALIENQRYQTLYQQGAISASQSDSQRLRLETAQKNLQEAQAQLQRLQMSSQQKLQEAEANLAQITEVRGVDVVAAVAEVNSALAAMNQAQVNLNQAYVRSPQDGQVLAIHTQPGEIVSSSGIAEIGQTSQMYVIAEVYESDISKVKVGQSVRIIGDYLPAEMQGTVERKGLQIKRQNVVNTDPTSNIDNRVVEVQIRLNTTSSQQAADLTNMQVKAVIEL